MPLRKAALLQLALGLLWPQVQWAFAAPTDPRVRFQPLTLPPALGSIREQTSFSSGPLVLYIQDLHGHMQAQEQILRLIQYLTRVYDIGLLGLEGAAGRVDIGKIASFPNREVREDVCRALLRQGRVSGAEAAAVLEAPSLPVEGVEDAEMHSASQACLDRFLKPDILQTCAELLYQVKKKRERLPSVRKRLPPSVLTDIQKSEAALYFLGCASALLQVSATPGEAAEFCRKSWEARWQNALACRPAFLFPEPARLQALKNALRQAEKFYHLAERRSQCLAVNLVAAMRQRRVRAAILVAGGYHARAVMDRLGGLGINAVTLVPRVTRSENSALYFSRLRSEPLPLDGIVSGANAFAPATLFPAGPAEAGRPETSWPAFKRRFSRRLELGLFFFGLSFIARQKGHWRPAQWPEVLDSRFSGFFSTSPGPQIFWEKIFWEPRRKYAAVPLGIGSSSVWADFQPVRPARTWDQAWEQWTGSRTSLRFYRQKPVREIFHQRLSDFLDFGGAFRFDLYGWWSLQALLAPVLPALIVFFIVFYPEGTQTVHDGLLYSPIVLLNAAGPGLAVKSAPGVTAGRTGIKVGQRFKFPDGQIYRVVRIATLRGGVRRATLESETSPGKVIRRLVTTLSQSPVITSLPEYRGGWRWLRPAIAALLFWSFTLLLVPKERDISTSPAVLDKRPSPSLPQPNPPAPLPVFVPLDKPAFVSSAPRRPAAHPAQSVAVACPVLPSGSSDREAGEAEFLPPEYPEWIDLFAVLCNLGVLTRSEIQAGLALQDRLEMELWEINAQPGWQGHPGLARLMHKEVMSAEEAFASSADLNRMQAKLARDLERLEKMISGSLPKTPLARNQQKRLVAVAGLQAGDGGQAEYDRLNAEQIEMIRELRRQGIQDSYIADLMGLRGVGRNLFLLLGYVVDGEASDSGQWQQAVAYFYLQRSHRLDTASPEFLQSVAQLQGAIADPNTTAATIRRLKLELNLYVQEIDHGYWRTPVSAPGRERGSVSLRLLAWLAGFGSLLLGVALPLGMWAGVGLSLSLAAGFLIGGRAMSRGRSGRQGKALPGGSGILRKSAPGHRFRSLATAA